MDAMVIARYGLFAAERSFETSATRIAAAPDDQTVDPTQEMVGMIQAKQAFSANLAVVRFSQDMWRSLMDLQSR